MNIVNRFHKALLQYGLEKHDLFQTNDLSEKKDIANVTNTIFALGRAVSSNQGCWRIGTTCNDFVVVQLILAYICL